MKNDSNLVSKKGEEKEALSQGSFPEKILLSFELLLSITTTDLPSIKLPKSISKLLHINPKKVSACVSCFQRIAEQKLTTLQRTLLQHRTFINVLLVLETNTNKTFTSTLTFLESLQLNG